MKFGRTLLDSEVPAWRGQYLNYKELKKQISRVESYRSVCLCLFFLSNQSLGPESQGTCVGVEEDTSVWQEEEKRFVEQLHGELEKIRLFDASLKASFLKRVEELQHRSAQDPEIGQFFDDLESWRMYRDLNSTGAIKILKKRLILNCRFVNVDDKKTGLSLKKIIVPELIRMEFFLKKEENFVSSMGQNFKMLINYSPKISTEGENHPCSYLPFCGPFFVKSFQVSAIFYAIIFFTMLAIELLLLFFWKNPIQEHSGYATLFFQKSITHPLAIQWSKNLHNFISSHLWLLLCSIVYWSCDQIQGLNMYLFVVAGFAVKSLAKNLIASPRVFWLFEQHNAIYCGTGYSLPSGHSMVSSMTLGFLVMKYQHPLCLLAFFIYAVFVFVNVIFIGTHTIADVVVGWTFAVFLLALYQLAEKYVVKNWECFKQIPVQLLLLIGFTAITFFFDLWEFYSHDSDFDKEGKWQKNMETVCHMIPGSGARKMQLRLKFSSTPLVFGVGVAYLLFANVLPKIDQTWPQCIVQTLLGWTVSSRTSSWAKALMSSYFSAPGMCARFYVMDTDLKFHLCNLIDPIWIVIGAPLCSSYLLKILGFLFYLLLSPIKPRRFLGVHIPSSVSLWNVAKMEAFLIADKRVVEKVEHRDTDDHAPNFSLLFLRC